MSARNLSAVVVCLLLFGPKISHQHQSRGPIEAVEQVSMLSNNANGSSNLQSTGIQQPQAESSVTNFYMNSQAQKFRVNVSNICEKSHMRATVRLNRPFYGLIHTKDKRRNRQCSIEGTGDQTYTLEISYNLLQTDPNYCGVVSHQLTASSSTTKLANQSSIQQQQTLSVALVVRLHKSIEFSDDRYFLLSCAK